MKNVGSKVVLPKNCLTYSSLKVAVTLNFGKGNFDVEYVNEDGASPSFIKNGIVVKDCNAIARQIGCNELWGKNVKETALIYQWLEFADAKLYPSVCTCCFPSWGLASYNKEKTVFASSKILKCLGFLNDHLLDNMYLVGDQITEADITCAAALLPAFQILLNAFQQQEYSNVSRWFKTLINQPEYSKVLKPDSTGSPKQTTDINKESSVVDKQTVMKKSAVQLKKETKKKEKMEKFLAKQKKLEGIKPREKKETKKKSNKSVAVTYDSRTAPGEKKDTRGQLPESYSPKYVEAAWYSWWEKMGFFRPEYTKISKPSSTHKNQFMICLPPPNVTGSLHLGHALTNTVEDVLARWHRMKGQITLWTPGTDHAGIATQVVVEKKLWKEKKVSRHDLGREAFVDEVWNWKAEKGNRICYQLRKLGSSLDWSREFFTMNENLSEAVKYSFVQLHDRGIIFRSNRLVNWSCTLRSAISDIEVNKKELSGRTLLNVPGYCDKVEFGVLISFAYAIEGSSEKLIVATTRIETMLGDTAVAVHPNDPRYKHLHGKFVRHPFTNRLLPIVCDEMVDLEFGTGAVKITPAHDANDYECGKRHNLPFITIFTDDGYITNTNTKFDGIKRFEARTAVLQALKEKGLYCDTKDNPMVVPICSRSKDIVEPLIKLQWFMNCKEAAKKAVQAVKNGDLRLIPDMHCKTWYYWLENIRDWCISRQLWWGHRIPAYFVTILDPNVSKSDLTDGNYWVSGMSKEEAASKAAEKFGVDVSKIELQQDEDVLDTWYSAGLLPFSIFGWPNQTDDLGKYFPGSLLETGHDIIFFWVARMVMFSILLTGKLPFKEVYFHAMVRDAHGRKMSKSLGNVIDPIDVINGITLEELHDTLTKGNLDPEEVERAKNGQKQDYPNGIPECGTDALRFALCAYTSQGRDINLDVLRVLGYRHFCNKIWNAFRFATRGLGENFQPLTSPQPSGDESLIDRWILSKLSQAVKSSNDGLTSYDFPVYTTAIFNFWLYDLCDVYLEYLKFVFATADKERINVSRAVLYTCLDVGLRLVHPAMPFISEELWQRLPQRSNDTSLSISVSLWPEVKEHSWLDVSIEEGVNLSMNIIKAARSLRAQYNLTKIKAEIFVRCSDVEMISKHQDFIQTLSSSSLVHVIGRNEKPPSGCILAVVNAKCDVSMLLKGVIDFKKELSRLRVHYDAQLKKLKEMRDKMNKPLYKSKVPQTVQENDRKKTSEIEVELQRISISEDEMKKLVEGL